MPSNSRDDFNPKIKDILAKRVNYICSSPTCRTHTIGPHTEEGKSASIGVAAHITAASVGGPRYDAGISPADRAGIANGIWLCQNCSTIIDRDPDKYPVELLRKWKSDTENEIEAKRGKPNSEQISGEELPFLEANLIYDNSGRCFDGYSLEIINRYRDNGKPIDVREIRDEPSYYKLTWNYQLMLINNSEAPAYNIKLEFVSNPGRLNLDLDFFQRKNNLKALDHILLKATISRSSLVTYVEADEVLKELFTPLLNNIVMRVSYQDGKRANHSILLTIKERGEIISEVES